jgi:hypothetical protein
VRGRAAADRPERGLDPDHAVRTRRRDLDLDGPPAIAYHHYAAGRLTTTYRVV